jgi:hypothetical protein
MIFLNIELWSLVGEFMLEQEMVLAIRSFCLSQIGRSLVGEVFYAGSLFWDNGLKSPSLLDAFSMRRDNLFSEWC